MKAEVAVLDTLVVILCMALGIKFALEGEFGVGALAFFIASNRARIANW